MVIKYILPNDLIDIIITSNSNTIITFLYKYDLIKEKSIFDNNRIIKLCSSSSWFRYFNLEGKTKQDIQNKIEILMKYYKIIVNSSLDSQLYPLDNTLSYETIITVIEKFEQMLNDIQFETRNHNFENYINNLCIYYGISNELIPDIIKIFLIIVMTKPKIKKTDRKQISDWESKMKKQQTEVNFALKIIIHGGKLEDGSDIIYDDYYTAKFGFIPLITTYCGMGYDFIIGWDLTISRMIGFFVNGSSIYDMEYNRKQMLEYFNLKKKVKLQKVCNFKLEEYFDLFNFDEFIEGARNLSIF